MVWVRSLVPKEKKSAASAIRWAVSAARGSSIMVPIGIVSVDPGSAATSAQDRVGLVADQVQLHHRADERHHDLHLRVFPAVTSDARGLGDRPHLHGEQAGHRPARAARRAARASGSTRAAAPPRPAASASSGSAVAGGLGHRHLDRQLGAVGQELVQRRVEQPDGHRQPVHRVEQLDEVLPLQRQQRAQRRVALLVGVGQDHPLDQRPAGRRGTCARCGTARCPARRAGGPARRPRRCRRWPAPAAAGPVSACAQQPVHGPHQLAGLVVDPGQRGVQPVLDVGLDRRRHHRRRRRGTPRRWSRRCEITSPSLITVSPTRARAGRGVDVERLGAADAGPAHAAGDHRGVARSCRRGRSARRSAAIIPSRSSGLVSRRTSTTCSPRSAHSLAVGESNTARPDRGAGRGGHAPGQQRPLRRRGRTAGTSAAPAASRRPGTAPRPG